MKLIAIILGFGAFASAIEQTKHQLPAEKLQKIREAGDTCAAELKLDPGVFAGVADGTGESTDATNKYFYCFLEKLKLVDESGHVDVDKVANYLDDNPLLEKFKEALQKCNELTKDNPVDTLHSIHRCYFDTSPVLFVF